MGHRSSPGCKAGRSIGERPVSPEPRGAAAVAPRHLPLALRSVTTLLSHSRSCTRITEFSFEMEYKHWWWFLAGIFVLSIAVASVDAEVWEESDHEVLIRSARGAKNKGETCRYSRGAWSECDFKTNFRFRTLTLKKGDPGTCERTKTIQKKCKKPCRYEKSSWSECSADGEMSRVDKLKANSDPACDQSRRITKKCNKNKQMKATKDKGHRNRQ